MQRTYGRGLFYVVEKKELIKEYQELIKDIFIDGCGENPTIQL